MNVHTSLLFSLFTFIPVFSAGMEKPGKCLPWVGGGPEMTLCNNDWDCNGLQKCCKVGSGRMCQDPCHTNCDVACVMGRQCKVIDGCAQCVPGFGAQEKPGKCMPWTGGSINLNNCETDSNCSGNKKCCSVGSGRLCQDPCKTTCEWVCTAGTECKVVDGCAQCVAQSKKHWH